MVLKFLGLEYCIVWYPSPLNSGINLYWPQFLECNHAHWYSSPWNSNTVLVVPESIKLGYQSVLALGVQNHAHHANWYSSPLNSSTMLAVPESIKLKYQSVCGRNFWSVKIMHLKSLRPFDFYVHLHEVLAYCCTLKIFTSIWFFSEQFFFFLFDKLILVNKARTSCKWTRVTRHCQIPWNNAQGFLHN